MLILLLLPELLLLLLLQVMWRLLARLLSLSPGQGAGGGRGGVVEGRKGEGHSASHLLTENGGYEETSDNSVRKKNRSRL